jgi:transcriptional regulator
MPQANNHQAQEYPAKHYQSTEKQRDTYHKIIEDNPLATLIFNNNTDIEISHIPCHFSPSNKSIIMAHVSNQHPLAIRLQQSSDVIISLVFHGDDAYVSPNDVSAKNSQAQKVPTWNYAKVHINGMASEIKDSDEKYNHMAQTTDYFERKERSPLAMQEFNKLWSLANAPEAAIKHMLNAITVFTVQVDNIEGRLKLSQNKSKPVKEQIAKQLTLSGSAALGQLMLEI